MKVTVNSCKIPDFVMSYNVESQFLIHDHSFVNTASSKGTSLPGMPVFQARTRALIL